MTQEVRSRDSFPPTLMMTLPARHNPDTKTSQFSLFHPHPPPVTVRWLGVFLANKAAYRIQQQQEWGERSFRSRGCFNLAPLATTSPPNLATSPHLARLVFTQPAGRAYAHLTHTMHCIPETTAHLQMRTRHACLTKRSHTPPTSPTKVCRVGQ